MSRFDLTGSSGLRIACFDLGGSGQPAILVHGAGLDALSLRPLAEQLTSRYRCLAIDLRGHGASARPPSFAWAGFAEDVLAVVEHLGGETPVGIGHSLGATALLAAAASDHGEFTALYCYEPIIVSLAPPQVTPETMAERARRRVAAFSSPAAALERLGSRPPFSSFQPDALAGYLEGGLVPRADGSVGLACRPEDEAAIYEAATEFDAAAALGSVDCPVTIAFGDQSDAVPEQAARAIAARIGRARTESLAGLDHFGPLREPGARRRFHRPRLRYTRGVASHTCRSPTPSSLSPSKIARFTQCPLAFRYSYIDRLPEPPTIQQVRGTLVHRALELLFSDETAADRTIAGRTSALEEAWDERSHWAEFLALGLDEDGENGSSRTPGC